jgi:biotin transport system substrate-specific component
MQQLTVPQPNLETLATSQRALRTAGKVIASTALVAICAHIAVPLGFTPVPVTMQTFAVLLLGLLLGPAAGFASLALYLLEGAFGLPVFSPHGPGGMAQLFGPTGGYLLSYPFAAAFAGALYQRFGRSFFSAAAATTLGSAVILASGALWLGVLTHAGAGTVFSQSVLPFLPGDVLKIAAAAACARAFGSLARGFRPRTV